MTSSLVISAFFSIAIFLLVLSFLVLIHELGHFLAAKFINSKVEEFGLGYPPRVKKLFKKWNTDFTLNWIPFGGFVKIYGEELVKAENKSESRPFYEKPALQRLMVILAGPVINLIFGVLAFSIIYAFVGIPSPLQNQARIAYITPGSPAEKSGLQVNTNLISLKDAKETIFINSIEGAILAIGNHKGQTVTLTSSGLCYQESCQENLQEYEVYLRRDDEIEDLNLEGSLGVAFQAYYLKFYPWYEMPLRGIITGFKESVDLVILTVQELAKMTLNIFNKGKIPGDVMGPLGIGHAVVKNQIFSEGFLSVLHFSGLLSLGLAVMNLLPIPALDGGRALFIILEKIIGKKRVDKFETKVNYGGFIILLSLIILITAKDTWEIVEDIYHFFI